MVSCTVTQCKSVCLCANSSMYAYMTHCICIVFVTERRLNSCCYQVIHFYLRVTTCKVAGLLLGRTAIILIELTVNGLYGYMGPWGFILS